MALAVFGVGLILSQFYVFKSGIPQPSHYFLALSFAIFFFNRAGPIYVFPKERESKGLLLFFVYSLAINSIFTALCGDTSFIASSLYICYGLMMFVLVREISRAPTLEGYIATTDSISLYSFFGIVILFILALFGLGEFKYYPRYNAFFNDPNQMAFWVLCSSAIVISNGSINHFFKAICFLCAFFLIFMSASRSGLVGFASLFLGFLSSRFGSEGDQSVLGRTMKYAFGLCCFVGILFGLASIGGESYEFLIGRIDSVDAAEQADIRGYTRILDFPEYTVFGSGQGLDERFNVDGTEIHSTWAGLLFYYGFPGVFLLLSVVFNIFSRLNFANRFIFLGPLFYSFSTYGLRTPIFWIFLGYFCRFTFKHDGLRRRDER